MWRFLQDNSIMNSETALKPFDPLEHAIMTADAAP